MKLSDLIINSILSEEDVLPEAMKKTLEVKELLERGKASSVWEAVQRVDLSRSAFYKYRDTVYPFHTVVKERIIQFVLLSRGSFRDVIRIIKPCRFLRLQYSNHTPDDSAARQGECDI